MFKKLSFNPSLLSEYLAKKRLIPPTNFFRYMVSGIVSYNVYSNLNIVTSLIYDSTDTNRKFYNLCITFPIAYATWYVPYIAVTLYSYDNYTRYLYNITNTKLLEIKLSEKK